MNRFLLEETWCALALCLMIGASSCVSITDCGGPFVRHAFAAATMRDAGDTLSIDGYADMWEERHLDGTYIHQLVVGIAATDAAHNDTIPSALRPRVIGARLELEAGNVLFRVPMDDNTSRRFGPPVLSAIPNNDVEQSLYDGIRSHLLAQDVSIVVETDSPVVQFPRSPLVLRESSDWHKTSGCQ